MEFIKQKEFIKTLISFELKFMLTAFLFSLAYELAHSPLYIFVDAPTLERKLYYIVHCAFRDLAPFLIGYHITALMLKKWLWLYEKFSWRNVAVFTFLAFVYTVLAELYHVHVLGSWEFKDAMPMVPSLGIGVTPFVQNLILPPVVGKVLAYFERK